MKNKTFFQLNFFWQLFSLFFLFFGLCSIYFNLLLFMALSYGVKTEIVIVFLIITFCSVYLLYTFIRFEHLRISFKEEYLYTPSDWQWLNYRIQYETKIYYEEVVDIQLVRSEKNSLNKKITARFPSSGVEKTYIEFSCKDGKKKRIFVMYFTGRQRIKIIDEVKNRMKDVGNNSFIKEAREIVNSLTKCV